jgi:hypothetical protein
MDQSAWRIYFQQGHPTGEAILFTNAGPGEPDAASLNARCAARKDHAFVKQGYLHPAR